MNDIPEYDVDFYGDDFIADPLPHYARMRALGGVVYLPQLGNYAAVRFDEVRQALRNHRVFRSGEGVAGDDAGCAFLRGNTLASDPPIHDEMRKAMGAPLLPGALEQHRRLIESKSAELVERLRSAGRFDGMADVAQFLPLTVVTELVGLPRDGRDRMIEWAGGSFDILGVQNARGAQGVETVKEMRAWIAGHTDPAQLKPGSWTARIACMMESGELSPAIGPQLIRDYINPSLDTTISATGELLLQLARNPDQWDKIRVDPALIPAAVEEAVRLATPIRSFSRFVAEDCELGGVSLPQGARLMLVFASANRDPLHFADPDRFDVQRTNRDHLGFGLGVHMCVGMHLARLEITALLKAFAPHIRQFEAGEPTVALNNTIRSYKTLPMTVAIEAEPRAVPASEPVAEEWIDVDVVALRAAADGIREVELAAHGGALPGFEAGAHIMVELAPGLTRPYSLCGKPSAAPATYRIAVYREPQSRGGSAAVHGRLALGDRLRIARPRNHFPLNEDAGTSVLVAGGIGLTPILAMAYRLHELGRDFRMIFLARNAARAAFVDELATAPFADRVRIHFSEVLGRDGALAELDRAPQDAEVYCCGPAGLIDAVAARCAARGLRPERVNSELFGRVAGGDDRPFQVVARKSSVSVHVARDQTILDALAGAGVDVPHACLSGMCGACLTDVVSGAPDHRDMVQTEAEKQANTRIAVCCSRAAGARLVLDV